jgi:hypothetical protein
MNHNDGFNNVRRSSTEPMDSGMDLVHPSLRGFTYLDCRRRAQLIAGQAGLLAGRIYCGDQFASNYFVVAVR